MSASTDAPSGGLVVARVEEVSETVDVLDVRWVGHRPIYEVQCNQCGFEDQASTWDAAVIIGQDHACPPGRSWDPE